MSDLAYKAVCFVGRHPFWVSSRPVRLHLDRIPADGPAIVAPTHLSPFDVPCLMAASKRRNLDFVSVVEFQRTFFVGWLFTHMNCVFLDRGRVDTATVRAVLDRLAERRMVVMFPEGRIREWKDSAALGKPFKTGVARMARMSGAPIVPVVQLGTGQFGKWWAWLPLRRVRYGMIVGEPIAPRADLEPAAAEADLTARLSAAYVSLTAELRQAMPWFRPPAEVSSGP